MAYDEMAIYTDADRIKRLLCYILGDNPWRINGLAEDLADTTRCYLGLGIRVDRMEKDLPGEIQKLGKRIDELQKENAEIKAELAAIGTQQTGELTPQFDQEIAELCEEYLTHNSARKNPIRFSTWYEAVFDAENKRPLAGMQDDVKSYLTAHAEGHPVGGFTVYVRKAGTISPEPNIDPPGSASISARDLAQQYLDSQAGGKPLSVSHWFNKYSGYTYGTPEHVRAYAVYGATLAEMAEKGEIVKCGSAKGGEAYRWA
jgi:hypothetical protein